MGKLIYSYLVSLDGYVAGPDGRFGWAVPDEEVLAFLNASMARAGTYLYGRRIYELMEAWENDPAAAAQSEGSSAFADLWQEPEKVVFSRTLAQVTTRRTRLEREFDPELIRRLKAETDRDLYVSGAELAGVALRAGLVDEVELYLAPKIVGGGKPMFPDGLDLTLDLLDEHRFTGGMVFLRYAVR